MGTSSTGSWILDDSCAFSSGRDVARKSVKRLKLAKDPVRRKLLDY